VILAFVELLASPIWIGVLMAGVLVTALFGSSKGKKGGKK
jgi:formate-dependent nitrite reductase membrane component NrfD